MLPYLPVKLQFVALLSKADMHITFFNLFTKSGRVIEDLAQSCEQSASIERDVSLRLPNTVIDFFPISC